MRHTEDQLRTFALNSGLLTDADFSRVYTKSKTEGISITDALLQSGIVSDTHARRAISHISGTPFISLVDETIPFEILSLIPESIARTHTIVPFKKEDKKMHVAVLDIADVSAINFLKKDFSIIPRLTDVVSMRKVLGDYKNLATKHLSREIHSHILEHQPFAGRMDDTLENQEIESSRATDTAHRLVTAIITRAVREHASDIHIEQSSDATTIRYRINGRLYDSFSLSSDVFAQLLFSIKTLAQLPLGKTLSSDGYFTVKNNGAEILLRVSLLSTHVGKTIVLSIIQKNTKGFSLFGLGCTRDTVDQIHQALSKKEGLILVTGPETSGKTTLLYAMLDMANTRDVNIITLENTIAYAMPNINQVALSKYNNVSPKDLLQTIINQDPDIVMVDTDNNEETLTLTTNIVRTGRTVFGGLSGKNAARTIVELIKQGFGTELLLGTLQIIIATRLVRTLSQKEKYFLNPVELKALGKVVDLDRMLLLLKKALIIPEGATWETVPVYRPKETEGDVPRYQGKTLITETIVISPDIKDCIGNRPTEKEVEQQAKKDGMITMLEDGIMKAVQGITTIEDVLEAVLD